MMLPTLWAMGEAPITAKERGLKKGLSSSCDDGMLPFEGREAFKLRQVDLRYFIMRIRFMMHSRPADIDRGFPHRGQLNVGTNM
mgnify:CR=1 FL=1